MKLKKIIASLTAAAMAVTTMAFAPLSVSAQTFDPAPSGKETKLASLEFTPPVKLDSYGSSGFRVMIQILLTGLRKATLTLRLLLQM